ncbi:MAG: DedA family protein [Myxococcaceae bacterium]|nr:DedA family protein [Myxococcaceae bacterium]MBH2006053.1 DedA family protein [Myxococcaceae bacterium]
MFHEFIRVWFNWLEISGYWGVAGLMALESSIVPIPSELVIPPAAFWASQGRLSFEGVVLAGTLGSYIGSSISYWLCRWLGHPLLEQYGRYLGISPIKVQEAERWIHRFGITGILIARFLPVVRHLISMPAGLFRMPFGAFSGMTILGSAAWCTILTWVGQEILGDQPELLNSPEVMIAVIRDKLHWILVFALLLSGLYGLTLWFKHDRQVD